MSIIVPMGTSVLIHTCQVQRLWHGAVTMHKGVAESQHLRCGCRAVHLPFADES